MTDGSRGRPRSNEARQAILTAALALAERDGYTAVTMKGIAEAAGVGRATVYRWWPTRAAVLMEALNELSARVATPAPAGGPEADLLTFLTATFAMAEHGPSRTVLLGLTADAQHDPGIAAAVAELTARRRALLRGLLERLDGEWNVPLELVVDMVFGAMWYRMIDLHDRVDATTAAELCRAVEKLMRRQA
ncbi:TetR/AcrR family transcriptional regulator [Kitasatospora acidiphila]|uniref:TetR/AcrR family transcriptional regulator n=1 Tax=Kitasatospora acidiphila TaxID=2567942 RepID=A0A540W516_9ACTN|nr:TetR/AcrR family transcriptional regulator [Kitasatospora acidiphila]TQF04118.1 TetR/AcrR family transcriptional regulator [Kitasatospora acidiphila]